MVEKMQRLELTWVDKEKRFRLEPRILLEDRTLTYRANNPDNRRDDHLLLEGDNLLALKALEQELSGRVKCVYIDPPYNTGSAWLSYDDGREHSLWLSLMRPRLEALWRLLTEKNGVLLISINDDECHYLKVLCDEIFGRSAFICSFVWNYEGNTDNQAKIINYHEYILVYSKSGTIDDPTVVDPNIDESSKIYRPEIRNTVVKNGPKNPPVDVDLPKGFPASFAKGVIKRADVTWPQYSRDLKIEDNQLSQKVTAKSGWSSRKILERFISNDFRPVLDSKDQLTRFELTSAGAIEGVKVRQETKGHVTSVLRNFGTVNQMRLMLEKLGLNFTYPKPVDLIAYLIEIFSGPDDIILDSFAGSGTTAHAVMKLNAEKGSKRRCVLVELEEATARNVIVPRLQAVIEGNEKAGVTRCGGGFRYLRLAPSLLEKDTWGNWVVSKKYQPEMLAEAMCKLEGFLYSPDANTFWIHGKSTESDFIYVTTQSLNRDQLTFISDQVGTERTLLVCCSSFRVKDDAFHNLTLKKIPQAVLSRCEWSHDDYSLNIRGTLNLDESAGGDDESTAGFEGEVRAPFRQKRVESRTGQRQKSSTEKKLPLAAGANDQRGKRK